MINNPSDQPTEDNSSLYRAIWASFLTQSTKNTLDFTLKLLKEETVQLLTQGTKIKDLLLKVSRADSDHLAGLSGTEQEVVLFIRRLNWFSI